MTEIEKTIADLLASGMKVSKIAETVGYSERQIYRIKKKLKARLIPNETTRSIARNINNGISQY